MIQICKRDISEIKIVRWR